MWVQGRAEVRTDARCGRPRARPVPGKRALRHPRRPRAPPPARAPSRPPRAEARSQGRRRSGTRARGRLPFAAN